MKYVDTKGRTHYLNFKIAKLKNGVEKAIYFFTRDPRGLECDMPEGHEIKEGDRTGYPFLKKTIMA